MEREGYGESEMDTDVLLAVHEQLREEIRGHGKRKSRRYLGSLTITGVVLGYVFTSNGDGRVLVLVPYVLAFLYFSHISSSNYVAQLASLTAMVEKCLNHPGAEYEYYHGAYKVKSDPRFDSGTYPNGPKFVQERVQRGMRALAFFAYVAFGVAGITMLVIDGVPLVDSLLPQSGVSYLLVESAVVSVFALSYGYLLYLVKDSIDAHERYVDSLTDTVAEMEPSEMEGVCTREHPAGDGSPESMPN